MGIIFQRDALNRVICNIRIPLGPGQNEETGTAIFIEKNNEPFLLTAAHVVKKVSSQAYAILSDTNGVPTRTPLNILLGGTSFTTHPLADLALAKINLGTHNFHLLSERCFPYDQIDFSDNLISKDVELTTIGFPLGLGSSGARLSPLSFRTFAAASIITLPRADNGQVTDFIILELPSVGGYSGGPVFDLGYQVSANFIQQKEKTILHGIVHGTISDATGGKLAAITPCKYLTH